MAHERRPIPRISAVGVRSGEQGDERTEPGASDGKSHWKIINNVGYTRTGLQKIPSQMSGRRWPWILEGRSMRMMVARLRSMRD